MGNFTHSGDIKDSKWAAPDHTSGRWGKRKLTRAAQAEFRRQRQRITVALQWQRFLTNPFGRGNIVLRNGRQVVLDRGATEGIYIERTFAEPLQRYPGRRSARLAKRQALEI